VKRIFIIIASLLFLGSCKLLNPGQMLRTPSDYQYEKFTEEDFSVHEYRIAPNDKLQFRLFTNEGEKIIDPIEPQNQMQRGQEYYYNVEHDGLVKLPVLGRIPISGLTIKEAEKMLEEKYMAFYNKPFVQLVVINNRVIIFPGGQGGTSTVVYLENSNTTLFEALALAGGINDGKAHRVKLIRGDLKNPKVYLIDLSTIEGVKNANLVLQANDIIYVEPREKIPQRILENISPYLTLLTTALLIYNLFK